MWAFTSYLVFLAHLLDAGAAGIVELLRIGIQNIFRTCFSRRGIGLLRFDRFCFLHLDRVSKCVGIGNE